MTTHHKLASDHRNLIAIYMFGRRSNFKDLPLRGVSSLSVWIDLRSTFSIAIFSATNRIPFLRIGRRGSSLLNI